ncbi:hypothetical protein ACEQPO_09905 [Bacillus sp. SL00103]
MTNRDFSKDQMVQTGHVEGGKYAVFTVTHTTEKVNLFWSQLPQNDPKQSIEHASGIYYGEI